MWNHDSNTNPPHDQRGASASDGFGTAHGQWTVSDTVGGGSLERRHNAFGADLCVRKDAAGEVISSQSSFFPPMW